MSAGAVTLVALAVAVYLLKATVPLVLAGRTLPPVLLRVASMLPVALLSALVVTSTVAEGRNLVLDARVVGIAVAGVALWRRAGFVTVVVLAALATALSRALGGG